ncbi:hypothetical protein AB0L65_33280 [Nonomuraea sp. NPDC052116]|uniref:hypothetical protein n=1 Tax=Nonomuraea sp. NPDC052116 TaxID=3155665 RepID=UPI003446E4CF
MRLPFTKRPKVGCPKCVDGQVVVTDFAMTKGKVLKARDCPSCSGRGTLKRR